MSKLTKNQKLVAEKIEAGKAYSLKEASALVKEITTTKFDASLDIDVRLGVDPRKANQMVRGVVSLPHGTGKTVRVLCLCTPDQENAAKEAGITLIQPRAGVALVDEHIELLKHLQDEGGADLLQKGRGSLRQGLLPQGFSRGKIMDGGSVGQDHRPVERRLFHLHLDGEIEIGPTGGHHETASLGHEPLHRLSVFR